MLAVRDPDRRRDGCGRSCRIVVRLYRPDKHQVHIVADCERVGGIDAAGADFSVEIDARIEGHAVFIAAGHAVGERGYSGHAAVGIQIAQLRGLREIYPVAVVGGARRELIALAAAASRTSSPARTFRNCAAWCRSGSEDRCTSRRVRHAAEIVRCSARMGRAC